MKSNRRVLVCRQCRSQVATGTARPAPDRDIVPHSGEYFLRTEVSDSYSEPIDEELNGWFIFKEADVATYLTVAGNRRCCRHGHLVGRVRTNFGGAQEAAVAFDPVAVVLVALSPQITA